MQYSNQHYTCTIHIKSFHIKRESLLWQSYGCERSSDTLDGWTVDTQEEWVSDVLYTCTIISNLAVRLRCTYMHVCLVIICHVPKSLWVWLHSIRACPLLGTYNHSIYRYKCMRLLTKFYCIVASQGYHFTLARYEWPPLAPWGVHEGNPGILTKQYPKKTPTLDISLLFSHKHWTDIVDKTLTTYICTCLHYV